MLLGMGYTLGFVINNECIETWYIKGLAYIFPLGYILIRNILITYLNNLGMYF